MAKCVKCKKEIPYLEGFPNGLCMSCYEKNFNEKLKKTGVLPKPDFARALNI